MSSDVPFTAEVIVERYLSGEVVSGSPDHWYLHISATDDAGYVD